IAAPRYGERFEEISEDEGGGGQGVLLDSNGYARLPRAGFASDELYFDGYDLGRDRQRRRAVYDYAEEEFDYSEEEEEEEEYRRRQGAAAAYAPAAAAAAAERERDAELVDSALARIAAARVRGKSSVNLTAEEMEALERRRGQPPERPAPPPPLPPPPPAPAL
ncbi:hypothetical protein LTR53_019031, partial [Teratosphaeriaceae sp. CCFEE 6253]